MKITRVILSSNSSTYKEWQMRLYKMFEDALGEDEVFARFYDATHGTIRIENLDLVDEVKQIIRDFSQETGIMIIIESEEPSVNYKDEEVLTLKVRARVPKDHPLRFAAKGSDWDW